MKPLTILSTFIAILIASALLLSAVSAALAVNPNPNPSPTSRNEQQRQAQEQSTGSKRPMDKPPLPVAGATANNQTNTSNNEAREWPDWFWPPQWSNWALVIVAAWAAYVAIRTLKAMERQVEVQES